MEDQDLKQALSHVAKALDKVNRVFENRFQELKQGGSNATTIRQTSEAVQSLRDSAAMYLAWAYHYADVPQPSAQITSAEEN